MARRKYRLQWIAASRRWRKQHKGKQHYFPLEEGETKESSYPRCLREWEAKKAEIDAHDQPQAPSWLIKVLTDLLNDYRTVGDAGGYVSVKETLRLVGEAVARGVELPIEEDGAVVDVPQLPPAVREARQALSRYEADLQAAIRTRLGDTAPTRAPWDDQADTSTEHSIGALLTQFEESNPTVNPYRLAKFREWCTPGQDAQEINGVYCRDYYDHIVSRVAAGEWSESYGKSLLSTFKQFVRWLYRELELLEHLPRNLEDLHITVSVKQVEVLTPADVKRYLSTAGDRLELYLLLMLNCGMTQIDVADLHPDEVDWNAGRVVRKRSKTGDHETVPECNYLLWDRTIELLRQLRSDDPDRVLLTTRGTPLATRMNGKGRNDSIRLAFRRLQKGLGEETLPLTTFKKTSASLINREYGLDLSQLFLGHAPRTVAEKHYIAEQDDRLDEPLRWLGEQYGL